MLIGGTMWTISERFTCIWNSKIVYSLQERLYYWKPVPMRQVRRKPIQITLVRRSGKGHGAQMCCKRFCISSWYQYLSNVQMNPFTPIPSHSATESQSFRLSVKIFRHSPLDGVRKEWQQTKNVFTGTLNELSAVLFQAGSVHWSSCSSTGPHSGPFQPSSPSVWIRKTN